MLAYYLAYHSKDAKSYFMKNGGEKFFLCLSWTICEVEPFHVNGTKFTKIQRQKRGLEKLPHGWLFSGIFYFNILSPVVSLQIKLSISTILNCVIFIICSGC